jgi:hypothetical protein
MLCSSTTLAASYEIVIAGATAGSGITQCLCNEINGVYILPFTGQIGGNTCRYQYTESTACDAGPGKLLRLDIQPGSSLASLIVQNSGVSQNTPSMFYVCDSLTSPACPSDWLSAFTLPKLGSSSASDTCFNTMPLSVTVTPA